MTNDRQASVTQISAPTAGAGPSTAIARMSGNLLGDGNQIVFTTVSQLPAILKDRSHSTIVNVAGVVIKVNPPKKIRNWMSTIIITDPTCVGEARTRNDLPVGIFRDAEAELPSFALGTPVLFINIRVKEQGNKPKIQAFPPDGMHWAYLKDGRVMYSTPDDPPLSADGEQKLRDLDTWHNKREGATGAGSGSASAPAPAFNEKPVTLLRDVSPGMYCKIAFKIVRLVDNRRYHESGDRRSPALELYISDGTIHDAHRPYEYHGRDPNYPTGSIVRLAIFEPPSQYDMDRVFRIGAIIILPNVRPEVYNHDALQLIWSDLLTKEQEEKGWRKKRATVLYPDDPQAVAIERRVQAVRIPLNEDPNQPVHPIRAEPPAYAPLVARAADPLPNVVAYPVPAAPRVITIPESNQISTTYQDPVKHKCTPLAEVLENQTVPNRFRIRARVAAIYPVSKKDGPLAVKFCTNCKSSFGSDKKHVDRAYCHSCNDVHVKNGELRYRFVILLTTSTTPNPEDPTQLALDDPASILPVLISDADAETILPALGLLTSTINADPKREKSLQQRLKSTKGQIEGLIMGSLMDMTRERPTVDWCVESYLARPRGGKGSAEGEGVVVYRMFGMVPGPQAGQQAVRTELVA